MEVDALIQVRHDMLLNESGLETDSKTTQRQESIRMTRGRECKCSSVEVNGLIQVR
jgi:hypothetical protein